MNARKSRQRRGMLVLTDRPVEPAAYARQPYLRQLLAASLTPGALTHAYIYHDDWCSIFQGGPCDCNPDLLLRAENETH